MTVALVIPKGYQPNEYVEWASKIAESRDESLLVLNVQRSRQAKTEQLPWGQAGWGSEESLSDLPAATPGDVPRNRTDVEAPETPVQHPPADNRLLRIRHEDPIAVVMEELQKHNVRLLILPRHRGTKSTSNDFELQRELFFRANCTTLQLSLGAVGPSDCRRILVPTRGSRNTADALRLATDIAETTHGHVDAIYVQQDIDDAAATVGERTIQRLIDRYADDEGKRVVTRSLVCEDVAAGIQEHANKTADLLVLGASYHSIIHRLLFSSITEQIISSEIQPAIAVVRPAAPWSSRIAQTFEETIGDVVPQLDRQRRVDLVERIHNSSRWDIDFVALMCLSTLIASLGLLQNSAAVVIGAMLVAPLMTPLLGAGLALVQGNRLLASCTVGAVMRGFVVALVIGYLAGMVTRPEIATDEMLARCSPGIPDLIVAFASGLAAAYANGRPNLISALPGVAIAAALVPPIATTGLVLAMGRFELAFGASLLFLTNIVAIVLGAACSLWAVGIRSTHAHSFVSSWGTRALLSLVIIAVGLGIYESASPLRVPGSLRRAIVEHLDEVEESRLVDISVTRSDAGQELYLVVAGPKVADQELLNFLSKLASEHFATPTKVRLESRMVQVAP